MCAVQIRNESHEDHSVASELLLLSTLDSRAGDLVTKKKGGFLAARRCCFPPQPHEESCSVLFKQVDTKRVSSRGEMGSFCK